MRAVAIYDAKNGTTDAEQLSARMELLERNPDMESRPNNEMVEVMEQFFKLSNETEDSDVEWPRTNGSENESEDESEDKSEDASDEKSDDESREEGQDKSDRICIRKVIKREQERVLNSFISLELYYVLNAHTVEYAFSSYTDYYH